jgi:hypothetical protein
MRAIVVPRSFCRRAAVVVAGLALALPGVAFAPGSAGASGSTAFSYEAEIAAIAAKSGLSQDQVQERASLAPRVQGLRDDAQRQFPDVFGGVYWQDNRIKLAFTRDAEAHRGQLVRNFPHPELVDAVTVKFPVAQLQAVADHITADSADLVRQGANLSSWGTDPTTNRVRVGVDHPTPAIVDNLENRYGSEILDIVRSAAPPDHCLYEPPDLHAGDARRGGDH